MKIEYLYFYLNFLNMNRRIETFILFTRSCKALNSMIIFFNRKKLKFAGLGLQNIIQLFVRKDMELYFSTIKKQN